MNSQKPSDPIECTDQQLEQQSKPACYTTTLMQMMLLHGSGKLLTDQAETDCAFRSDN